MHNRRKETRKCTSDYFLVYNAETDELVGRVMDLNVDGAMLISENLVDVPCTIKCKMALPESIGRHYHVDFEIAGKWCRKNNRLGWFETGYQVINISDTNRLLIEEITEEWIPKMPPSSIPSV